MAGVGIVPPDLKAIQPYLKIADEHDSRDPVISYWCRLYAIQSGLKINSKSKDSSGFLVSLMDWLEKAKKENRDNEAISNDVVAQAYIENYALKLFLWADGEDRAAVFNKNVVKAFYTAGIIYDLTTSFGEPSEEVIHHRKYAKWKATYIHNCLKSGSAPVPGPIAMEGDDGDEGTAFSSGNEDYNYYNRMQQPPNDLPTDSQGTPYPTIGFFDHSNSQPMTLIPPMPGAHAPPSTPNGSSQHSPSTSLPTSFLPPTASGDIALQPEDFHKAQKYCKYAGSALQYEDVPTAVDNLQKALKLLTTGVDE